MYSSDALLYPRVTCIPCLLEVKNYLNNYFAMYTCLKRTRIWVWNWHPPPTWDKGLFK